MHTKAQGKTPHCKTTAHKNKNKRGAHSTTIRQHKTATTQQNNNTPNKYTPNNNDTPQTKH
jgi:hypothetical protein